MFAIIAAIWSMFALYVGFCNWGWIEMRMLTHGSTWFFCFRVWLTGTLLIWLVPIYLLKFFIYLFS